MDPDDDMFDADSVDDDYYSGDADDYYNSDSAEPDDGGFHFVDDLDDDSDVYSACRRQVVWNGLDCPYLGELLDVESESVRELM